MFRLGNSVAHSLLTVGQSDKLSGPAYVYNLVTQFQESASYQFSYEDEIVVSFLGIVFWL